MILLRREKIIRKKVKVLKMSNVLYTTNKIYKTEELQNFLRTTWFLLFLPIFTYDNSRRNISYLKFYFSIKTINK